MNDATTHELLGKAVSEAVDLFRPIAALYGSMGVYAISVLWRDDVVTRVKGGEGERGMFTHIAECRALHHQTRKRPSACVPAKFKECYSNRMVGSATHKGLFVGVAGDCPAADQQLAAHTALFVYERLLSQL